MNGFPSLFYLQGPVDLRYFGKTNDSTCCFRVIDSLGNNAGKTSPNSSWCMVHGMINEEILQWHHCAPVFTNFFVQEGLTNEVCSQ